MLERLARAWCRMAHGRPMMPVHGRYLCAKCLREWRWLP